MYAISYTSIIIVMHTMRVVISEMNISQAKQIHAKKFIVVKTLGKSFTW